MRVLRIGLGDIARKAYLPVLSRRDLDIHLATQDATVLSEVGREFRIVHRHTSATEALPQHRSMQPSSTQPRRHMANWSGF